MMYEPPKMEIILTKLIGSTLIRPYYTDFVESLELTENETVLDFCSGSGIISSMISKKLDQGFLTCVDVSKKWLAEVNRKLKGQRYTTVYIPDLSVRPLGQCLFDKAVIHFSLHDFKKKDRVKVLSLVRNNLKTGGILIVREPYMANHGVAFYEMVNHLESLRLSTYTYSRKHYPLVGDTLDFRITIPC